MATTKSCLIGTGGMLPSCENAGDVTESAKSVSCVQSVVGTSKPRGRRTWTAATMANATDATIAAYIQRREPFGGSTRLALDALTAS